MICNCTPHNIKVYSKDHQKVLTEFPASGNQIRLESSQQFELPMLKVDGNEIPCVTSQKFNPKIKTNNSNADQITLCINISAAGIIASCLKYKGATPHIEYAAMAHKTPTLAAEVAVTD